MEGGEGRDGEERVGEGSGEGGQEAGWSAGCVSASVIIVCGMGDAFSCNKKYNNIERCLTVTHLNRSETARATQSAHTGTLAPAEALHHLTDVNKAHTHPTDAVSPLLSSMENALLLKWS